MKTLWVGMLLMILAGGVLQPVQAQMPIYTKGARADKVPGHNLVVIYPDKSPSVMDHQRRMERLRLQKSECANAQSPSATLSNQVIVNAPNYTYPPDSFITRVYQVQSPPFRGQRSYGYVFTDPYGFHRPYSRY